MNRFTPYLRLQTVIVLIGIAVLMPRLVTRTRAEYVALDSDMRARITLDYARKRLWQDFLERRVDFFPGYQLPAPTLPEYRAFLRAMGLMRNGDAIVLLVLSGMSHAEVADRIEITLVSATEPIEMTVSLRNADRGSQRLGHLLLKRDEDGSLRCDARHLADERLWSIWPITPQPLLP